MRLDPTSPSHLLPTKRLRARRPQQDSYFQIIFLIFQIGRLAQ